MAVKLRMSGWDVGTYLSAIINGCHRAVDPCAITGVSGIYLDVGHIITLYENAIRDKL